MLLVEVVVGGGGGGGRHQSNHCAFWLRWITGLFLGSGQRDEANVADAASPDAAAVVAMTSHATLQPERG